MSSKVIIQLSKYKDFTPQTIVKEVIKDFDHTSTLETLVEIEANTLKDKFAVVFGRAKYNVPDIYGESKWSEIRRFGFEGATEKFGICFNSESYSSDSIKVTDGEGNFVHPSYFFNTKYFSKIKSDLIDDFGNHVVEFPVMYMKYFKNGLVDSDSNGKKTILMSDDKADDSWTPHFVFHSDWRNSDYITYSNVRYFKYPCGFNIQSNKMISVPDESKYLIGITEHDANIKKITINGEYNNKYGNTIRFFDMCDITFLRIIMLLSTGSNNPSKDFLDVNNHGNDIFGIHELINSKYYTFVDHATFILDNQIENDEFSFFCKGYNYQFSRLYQVQKNYTHGWRNLNLVESIDHGFKTIILSKILSPNEPKENLGPFINTITHPLDKRSQSYLIKVGGKNQRLLFSNNEEIEVPGSPFTYSLTDGISKQLDNLTYRIVYNDAKDLNLDWTPFHFTNNKKPIMWIEASNPDNTKFDVNGNILSTKDLITNQEYKTQNNHNLKFDTNNSLNKKRGFRFDQIRLTRFIVPNNQNVRTVVACIKHFRHPRGLSGLCGNYPNDIGIRANGDSMYFTNNFEYFGNVNNSDFCVRHYEEYSFINGKNYGHYSLDKPFILSQSSIKPDTQLNSIGTYFWFGLPDTHVGNPDANPPFSPNERSFIGIIYEMLWFNYKLTLDELNKVEGYLVWKWDNLLGNNDLVFQLDNSHKYKNNKPQL